MALPVESTTKSPLMPKTSNTLGNKPTRHRSLTKTRWQLRELVGKNESMLLHMEHKVGSTPRPYRAEALESSVDVGTRWKLLEARPFLNIPLLCLL